MKRQLISMMMCALLMILSACGESKTSPVEVKKEMSETSQPTTNGNPVEPSTPTLQNTTPAPKQPSQMTVKVYFPDKQAMNLVEKSKEVQWSSGESKYDAVFKALLSSTDQDVSIVWKGQSAVNIKFENGILSVDLPKPIQAGSTVERFMISSLLKTMFQFSEVQKVQFLIGGKQAETLGGHMEINQPFTRSSLADL